MEEYNELAIETLANTLNNSWETVTIENNTIVAPKAKLTIQIKVNSLEDKGGVYSANLHFWVNHSDFIEPFFDSVASTGKTKEEAVKQGIAGFMLSAMCAMKKFAYKELVHHEITTDIQGIKNDWNVIESCVTNYKIGNAEEQTCEEFWTLLKDLIPNHLGRRKVLWLKIYAAKVNDNIIAECRFNNQVSDELSAAIRTELEKWPTLAGLFSKKQFMFFEQKEETYVPYPYTKAQIEDFSDKAIKIMGACKTDEEYERLDDDLFAITNDWSLCTELKSFIPEMCAQNQFDDVNYGEEITLNFNDESKNVKIYKDQFTPYYWIRDYTIDNFIDGKYSGDYYK